MSDTNPKQASSNRNLLFGLLALQLKFISQKAFMEAMHQWVRDKSTSIGQILTREKQLTPASQQLLDALVEEYVAAHQGDLPQSLAGLAITPAVQATLCQVDDSEVRASVASVVATLPARAPAGALTPSNEPSAGTALRYCVLRPHAQGGLGEVFVAEDLEVHREVALKQIKARLAHDPQCRERFLIEAEITGRLEHPGIVPVYGLGQYADGRPFYAMRFVQGHTLQEAIRLFHEADKPGRDPGERGLGLRQLLSRFVAICNAVAYAHSRGVLHRDLKPANIMLGKYGESLLLDWGLAKIVARGEWRVASEQSARAESDKCASTKEPACDLSPPNTRLPQPTVKGTQPGAMMGTPGYMSPEQTNGRVDLLGPASDVYSLGATLYTLLTGKGAFVGDDVQGTLEKVKLGEFPPPRRVKASVPAGLEAICVKAMALEPAARYASALELAAEVEHWLADEPVAAFAEPLPARVLRWTRRHRTVVTGVAAAVAVALVGLALTTGLLTAANRRERALRELAAQRESEAAQERDHAQANFRLARRAVEDYCIKVSDDKRLREELRPLRQSLLQTAVPFYEKFVAQSGAEPDLQADLAGACQRLGFITREIGDLTKAISYYERARAIQERLSHQQPDELKHRSELGNCQNNLGRLYLALGRAEDAEKAYVEALALLQGVADSQPDVAGRQSDLANVHNQLGLFYRHTRRQSDAEKHFQAALAIDQRLADAHPDNARYRSNLGQSLGNLGIFYQANGQFEKAQESHQRGLDVFQHLADKYPDVAEYQGLLAKTHNNLGVLYYTLDKHEDTDQAYQSALGIRQRLADKYPEVTEYTSELAIAFNNLGAFYHGTDKKDAAEAMFRSALAILARLVEQHPAIPRFKSDLANTHHNLAELYRGTGKTAKAEREFQAAFPLQKQLVEKYPEEPEYVVRLGNTEGNYGRMLNDNGRPQDALEWYAQAVERLRAELTKQPGHAMAKSYLGNAYKSRADAYDKLSRHRDAVHDWDEALKLDNGKHRVEIRLARAKSYARGGEHTQATAEAEELSRLPLDGSQLYALARACSLAAASVVRDTQRPAVEQKSLGERYSTKALELLTRAQMAGCFADSANRKSLKEDQDFAVLRPRAEFQKLLAELEKAN